METIALIALSLALAAAIAALVWAVREARAEGRMAIEAGKREVTRMTEKLAVAKALDEALGDVARLTTERDRAVKRATDAEELLAAAREVLAHARTQEILDADPDDVPAAVDRVLRDIAHERRRAAEAGGRPADADALQGPGPAADAARGAAWEDLR